MPRRPRLVSSAGEFIIPVIVDTREQSPFTFDRLRCDKLDGGGPLSVPTVRATLSEGDYSLLGFETRIAIERKSLADLYGTLGQGRDRFERELERLKGYKFAAVVIEATWPELCVDPPPHTKLPPKTVFRSILSWMIRYPAIRWIPAGPRELAEVTTFRLLERFAKDAIGAGEGATTAEENSPVGMGGDVGAAATDGGESLPRPESDEPWPTLDEVTSRHILATLTRCDGHKGQAAEMLGVAQKTIYNRLNAKGEVIPGAKASARKRKGSKS